MRQVGWLALVAVGAVLFGGCTAPRSRVGAAQGGGEGEGEGTTEGEGEGAGEGEGEGGAEGEGEGVGEGEGEGEGEGAAEGEGEGAEVGPPDAGVDADAASPCDSGGEIECGGRCIDVRSDPDNCGECNRECDPERDVCREGECVYRCEPDELICNGVCADTRTNSHHCGECFNRCRIDQDCVDAECVVTCPFGWVRCNGECTNAHRDNDHCGACGNACDAWLICRADACTCEDAALVDCLGACRDLTADHDNCGQCGETCPDDQVCADGECTCELAGHIVCDGRCVDSFGDTSNCGECGNRCEADVECNFGFCGAMREEREPNDSIATCNPIASRDWVVAGEVNGNHDFFCFGAEAGQTVTFDVDARNGANRPPASTLDSYLILHQVNPSAQLATNDDSDGLDSQITHRFAQAGAYAIEVASCCVSNGGPGAFYNLNIR